MSPCRSDCLFATSRWGDAWRTVSEDPRTTNWPPGFLLIVRTGQIVTAHVFSPHEEDVTRASTAGYSDVPAYSQVLQQPGIKPTVIVHVFPHIAMGRGPYLHPPASKGELCVWPLRIPRSSTRR